METWLASLPADVRPRLTALWREFEAQESREARLAKALDKMETLIQHNEASLDTWLPVEYELNFTYGQAQTDGDPTCPPSAPPSTRSPGKKSNKPGGIKPVSAPAEQPAAPQGRILFPPAHAKGRCGRRAACPHAAETGCVDGQAPVVAPAWPWRGVGTPPYGPGSEPVDIIGPVPDSAVEARTARPRLSKNLAEDVCDRAAGKCEGGKKPPSRSIDTYF